MESKPWIILAATGAITVMLYSLLFAYEKEVMASFTRTDGLYPLLPLAAAFVFSLSHGAFTGHFWHVLGVQAMPKAAAKVEELSDEADTD